MAGMVLVHRGSIKKRTRWKAVGSCMALPQVQHSAGTITTEPHLSLHWHLLPELNHFCLSDPSPCLSARLVTSLQKQARSFLTMKRDCVCTLWRQCRASDQDHEQCCSCTEMSLCFCATNTLREHPVIVLLCCVVFGYRCAEPFRSLCCSAVLFLVTVVQNPSSHLVALCSGTR